MIKKIVIPREVVEIYPRKLIPYMDRSYYVYIPKPLGDKLREKTDPKRIVYIAYIRDAIVIAPNEETILKIFGALTMCYEPEK